MSHPRRVKQNLPHPRPVTRRAMIQAGAVGLLGMGMNHVAALRAAEAAGATAGRRAKSVIYIFLSGGLAQHESFDMKPDAPAELRGEFSPIKTNTPGLHICEHLPMLAQRSEKWALCRSLTHPYNEHSEGHMVMLTGRTPKPRDFDARKPMPTDWPSIAALANDALPRVLSADQRARRGNLPPALVLPDKIVHRTGRVIPGQFAGLMGKRRDPWFVEMSPYHPEHYGAFPTHLFHHAKGKLVDPRVKFQAPHFDLPESVNKQRVRRRVALRDVIDKQRRALDSAIKDETFDRYRQAAFSLLLDGKVHDAFDLEKVDPKWLDRYGRNSFGWSLLLARRLVESGVNLVQVNLGNNETWDTHQGAFPNLKNHLLPPMDMAVSALLDDLDSRGLLDDTLIVMGSEFGRTPKVFKIPNAKLPGRDHWGAVQTVFFAGGGVKGGNVIGASDKVGGHPARDPQRPENMAATIYRALGLPKSVAWYDQLERPHYLYHADPIKGLI